MKAELTGFGEITIEGVRHEHDVVIEAGQVRKRKTRRSIPSASRRAAPSTKGP